MTTLCASLRDLIFNLLAITVQFICLPFSIWSCVKAFFCCSLYPRKPPHVPKVVAITGANSGIGEGIARAYAKDKVSLVLLARNLERLEKVAEDCREIGSPDVKVVQMDVADTQTLSEFLEEKTMEWGIDLFIANAGIASVANTPLLDRTEKILQINTIGAIAGINAAFKAMKKRGRGGQIAAVSSVLGFYNPATLLGYGASKAAVMSYCRDLRTLGKSDGILVNTIAPGYIQTPMTGALSKVPKAFYLTPEKLGETIKHGLENDVALISAPLHQFFMFGLFSTLPPAVKYAFSEFLFKYVDGRLYRKKDKSSKAN